MFSYRQTIHAYPSGGGAYIVAKDNLGETPALVAAAALLIDYVLTVAVSIAAGVAAITSAFPAMARSTGSRWRLASSCVLMLGNLRGIRESGRIFAVPTYFFVVSLLALIAVGAWRALTGAIQPRRRRSTRCSSTGQTLTLFLLLTAFSNGCTAMTGVEAVSNGVPAFKPPEAEERRRDDADDGRPVDHDVPRHHAAGAGLPRHAERAGDGRLADRARRLRRPRRPVLPGAGRDDADPGAGGEHGVCRLSRGWRRSWRATATCRASS